MFSGRCRLHELYVTYNDRTWRQYMNSQQVSISIAILSISLLVAGCNEEKLISTNNKLSNFNMVINDNVTSSQKSMSRALSAGETAVSFSDGAITFTITGARMNIRDIRFDTSNLDTVAGTTHTVVGPYVMNLLDGTALPSNTVFYIICASVFQEQRWIKIHGVARLNKYY